MAGIRWNVRVDRHVQKALGLYESAADAAIYLAVWIANDAASSATDRPDDTLVEAYRRVRIMAEEECADG